MVLLMLGGASAAIAESPTKAEKANHSAEVVVEKIAHRAAEAPPTPTVVKKVDPLEAALAQAMALSATPPTVPAPATPTAPRDGLDSLRRHTKQATRLGLDRSRSLLIPTGETVVHLDLQPLEAKLVSKLVTSRLGAIHYCHESLVARGLAEGGQVNLHFVIEPRGHVSTVAITAGGEHASELQRCMSREIRRWKFPAADAPTVVDYPIVFDVAGSTLDR